MRFDARTLTINIYKQTYILLQISFKTSLTNPLNTSTGGPFKYFFYNFHIYTLFKETEVILFGLLLLLQSVIYIYCHRCEK